MISVDAAGHVDIDLPDRLAGGSRGEGPADCALYGGGDDDPAITAVAGLTFEQSTVCQYLYSVNGSS